MLNNTKLDLWVGIFVAVGVLALLMLALNVSNLKTHAGDGVYYVTARFENVSGLKVRSPVMLAGVRIGQVETIELDPESLDVLVRMSIASNIATIPIDSMAGIYTAGILGERYVGLEAGIEEDFLIDGSNIHRTNPAMVLEKLIGQFMFNKVEE